MVFYKNDPTNCKVDKKLPGAQKCGLEVSGQYDEERWCWPLDSEIQKEI